MVPARATSPFTTELALLVKKYGMTPNLGHATDDKGYRVDVLDAEGSGVRLRSENVLLSGHEDPDLCGSYTEPHSDPGQYFISVSPDKETKGPRAAREMLVKVTKDLKAAGYDVRSEPMTCSPQSKLQAKL